MDYHDTVIEGGEIVKLTEPKYVEKDDGFARDQRSNLVDRRRAVRQVLCYICCAEFGASSLAIHQKTCIKKHKWGLDIVEHEEGVPKKKALANRKKCVEPGPGPTLKLPSLKSPSEQFEEYNTEALGLFYEHSEHCLWCRTRNFEAIENAKFAKESALQRKQTRLLATKETDSLEAEALKWEAEEAARRLKLLEEDAARRKAQEEEESRRRALEEEEAMRRALEEQEALRLAEEAEAAHRLAEEEARRLHDAEMRALLKLAEEEAAKRRKAEEELDRLTRELALKKQREEDEARRLRLQAEADAAKRRALELALIEAAEARLKAEAAALALKEAALREARQMEEADAEAEHYRMVWMMQERELRRRRSADMELIQKKKKVLGPHKFLRKKEGAVASSQGAAVYHDKKMDEQAIDDFTHFSIKHAKQEGKIQPHHEVFKHHDFVEVGEGYTYETIEEHVVEPPLTHTAATVAAMHHQKAGGIESGGYSSTVHLPTRESSPMIPEEQPQEPPPIEFVD